MGLLYIEIEGVSSHELIFYQCVLTIYKEKILIVPGAARVKKRNKNFFLPVFPTAAVLEYLQLFVEINSLETKL